MRCTRRYCCGCYPTPLLISTPPPPPCKHTIFHTHHIPTSLKPSPALKLRYSKFTSGLLTFIAVGEMLAQFSTNSITADLYSWVVVLFKISWTFNLMRLYTSCDMLSRSKWGGLNEFKSGRKVLSGHPNMVSPWAAANHRVRVRVNEVHDDTLFGCHRGAAVDHRKRTIHNTSTSWV